MTTKTKYHSMFLWGWAFQLLVAAHCKPLAYLGAKLRLLFLSNLIKGGITSNAIAINIIDPEIGRVKNVFHRS